MGRREPSERIETQTSRAERRTTSGIVARVARLPRPGEVVEGLLVGHALERGGTAAVLAATDAEGRALALKFLHPHLADDEEMLDMIRAEAAILARVDHPNVARVVRFATFEGLPYLALELVDGPTIRQVMSMLAGAGRALDRDVAFAICIGVADALAAAHAAGDESGQSLGVVHRDVSPSNVLIARDGTIKLIDFGVARSTARARQTNVGTFKGKAGYAAPEQLAGLPVDHRTDIFALGVVLHELLAMQRLFPGKMVEVLRTRWSGEPIPRLDEIDLSIPTALADLVARCLATDPDDRPRDASEVAAALRALSRPDASRRALAELAREAHAYAARERGDGTRSDELDPITDVALVDPFEDDAVERAHPRIADEEDVAPRRSVSERGDATLRVTRDDDVDEGECEGAPTDRSRPAILEPPDDDEESAPIIMSTAKFSAMSSRPAMPPPVVARRGADVDREPAQACAIERPAARPARARVRLATALIAVLIGAAAIALWLATRG